MDPLSLSVNIITLIGATQKIVNLIQDIKDAPEECKGFKLEAESSTFPLFLLRERIEKLKNGITSTDDKEWLDNLTAVLTNNQVFDQYQNSLDAIHRKLESLQKGKHFQSLRIAATWRQDKAAIREHFDKIGRLKSTIELVLSTASLDKTISTGEGIRGLKKLTETIIDYQEDSHRSRVMDWIYQHTIPFEAIQKDHITRAEAGTGAWFLEHEVFQAWLTGDQKSLLCPGIPGCGKTIIAAKAMEYISDRFPHHQNCTAVVYFRYKSSNAQGLRGVLFSILGQFLRCKAKMPQSITKLYGKRTGEPASAENLMAAIVDITRDCANSFIVIDALDELSNDKREDNREDNREAIVERIVQLQAAATATLRVMITARPSTELGKLWKPDATLQIYSAPEDIRLFLERGVETLAFLDTDDDSDDDGCWDDDEDAEIGQCDRQTLKGSIVERIIQAAYGVFLLASFHLYSLQDAISRGDAEDIINAMPHRGDAIEETYKTTIERIDAQVHAKRELARKVIGWIVCSQRPMSPVELRHAVAIRPQIYESPRFHVSGLKLILGACLGLVKVDKETDAIRLVHYTAQEYLSKTRLAIWLPDIELVITQSCITYALIPELHKYIQPQQEAFAQRPKSSLSTWESGSGPVWWAPLGTSRWPLFDYVRLYLGLHCVELQEDLLPLAMLLFENKGALSMFWYRVEHWVMDMSPGIDSWNCSPCELQKPEPLALAVKWRTERFLLTLLDSGHTGAGCPRPFLDGSTEVEGRIWEDWHPLSSAERLGSETSVRTLLGRTTFSEDDIKTIILNAMERKNHDIVELLLTLSQRMLFRPGDTEFGSEPSPTNIYRSERLAQIMVTRHQVDLEQKSAAWGYKHHQDGEADLARLFRDLIGCEYSIYSLWIDYYVRVSSGTLTHTYFEAVKAAVMARAPPSVIYKMLDIAGSGGYHRQAYRAAFWGGMHRARALFRPGPDTESYETFLFLQQRLQSEGLSLEIVREIYGDIFISTAKPMMDSFWRTEIDPAILQALLESGNVDINARDETGRCWLSHCAYTPRQDLTGLVLSNTHVDPSLPDFDGRTALSWAAEAKWGHKIVEKLMLREGVDINSMDELGRTALSHCAEKGPSQSLRRLIHSVSADVLNRADNAGMRPLEYTMTQDDDTRDEMMSILLSRKDLDVNFTVKQSGERLVSHLLLHQRYLTTRSIIPILKHEAMNLALDGQTPKSIIFNLASRPERWDLPSPEEKFLYAIIEILEQHGIATEINDVFEDGKTILIAAAENKHRNFIRCMFRKWGSIINVVSQDDYGHSAITRLLAMDLYEAEGMLKAFLEHFPSELKREELRATKGSLEVHQHWVGGVTERLDS